MNASSVCLQSLVGFDSGEIFFRFDRRPPFMYRAPDKPAAGPHVHSEEGRGSLGLGPTKSRPNVAASPGRVHSAGSGGVTDHFQHTS